MPTKQDCLSNAFHDTAVAIVLGWLRKDIDSGDAAMLAVHDQKKLVNRIEIGLRAAYSSGVICDCHDDD